jgi:hypothetical protein
MVPGPSSWVAATSPVQHNQCLSHPFGNSSQCLRHLFSSSHYYRHLLRLTTTVATHYHRSFRWPTCWAAVPTRLVVTAIGSPARDPADAGEAARDDGGLPRLSTACRRGVGRGSVGGAGGAGDRTGAASSGAATHTHRPEQGSARRA